MSRWNVRAWLVQKWEEIKAEQATPGRLGFALGVGVFVGCSPFHGFQFVIAVALAFLLRLNKIAVLIGLNISVPPFTPLVIFASIQLGELMRHQRLLPLSLTEIRDMSGGSATRALLLDLGVGGLTLGLVLGSVLGGLTTVLLRRRASHKASLVSSPRSEE